ncbi:MAG: two-component regulator propeller domain-containing protein [Pseudomonadota bacterium]
MLIKSTKTLNRWLGVFAAIVLSVPAVASADALAANQPMLFSRLSVDNGLSQSNVLAIVQDSEGMMWFGTEDGLNRYDGYNFEHFKRERGNSQALSNDFIFDVALGRDGALWLATNGGGLARLDRATGHVENMTQSANGTSSIIRRLIVDDAGRVWMATRNGGLDRFDPATRTFENIQIERAGEPHGKLFSLLIDRKGLLWVGGDHGLTAIDTQTGQQVAFEHSADTTDSLQKGSVRAIAQSSDGALWIGTYGGGLSKLLPGSKRFERFASDANNTATISGNRVTSILEDNENRLWVGTTRGLNLVNQNDGSATRYTNAAADVASISDNNITSLFQDRSGLLWVGTKMKGINTWNPRTWGLGFEPAEALTQTQQSSPNVTSFVTDDNGRLWVGTYGDGLTEVDRATGELTKFRADNPEGLRIGDDRVMSLLRDSEGMIWVGTMTQGLSVLNPDTGVLRQYKHDPENPKSLSANGIMALFEDRAGSVWVGTFGGGISRFDRATNSFDRFQPDASAASSLSSARVTAFAQDPSGMMWIGTDAGGLNLFDPDTERFHHYRHESATPGTLADDTVYALNIDAEGTVWVGTRGGGLDRVIGDVRKPADIRFSNISQTNGLSNDVVYGVQFDADGWMWLSTNYGISKIDPQSGVIETLHRRDGLQSEEFNFGAHHKSANGELFFGGHNGYNAFDPSGVTKNAVAPLIALTGFFKGNDKVRADVPLDEEGRVTVDWHSNDVSFEFAALDFTAPAENRYQYTLEGFDDAWIDLGTRRRVTYTDLRDGSFTLKVRAANSDGVWNDTGISIPVVVRPAPWNTWWAYVGYAALALLGAAALFYGHRRKLAREEAYSKRLENEVGKRTEQLSENNRQLVTLNTALQESSLSDPLTGLRNRRFVFEEVSRDLDSIQRRFNEHSDSGHATAESELVFMMIDLDNFKPINDTYGHAAGDQMLLEFRDVLQGICRRSDYLIRWGGDEFVVIAKHSCPEETAALAERIRATVDARHFTLGDGQVARTSCSLGFVAYPLFRSNSESANLDHIISIADGLMYEAKRQRNAWVGMVRPDEAITSENFDHGAIESTSLLFRARRAKNLARHDGAANKTTTGRSALSVIGQGGKS